MKNRKKLILTAVLCAAALSAGCGTVSAVSLEEAQQIALDTAGVSGAVFTERHLDPDDGVYEISFTAGGVEYEFEVDAKTGSIRETDREREGRGPAKTAPTEATPSAPSESAAAQRATDPNGRITPEEAMAIAYAHAGVSETGAYDLDFEWDDGRWEISFKSAGIEYDYDIAADGTILRAEKEADR